MKDTNNILTGLRIVERLKTINRQATVLNRQESTSEHSFHAVLIADMLADFYPEGVDAQRVKDLVLYHDLVEIHAGDSPAADTEARKNKEVEEHQAFKQLLTEVPNPDRYTKIYEEYEARETVESIIAKKIDRLEVMIGATNENRDILSQGYTETFLRETYDNIGQEIPIVDELHEEILEILKQQQKI